MVDGGDDADDGVGVFRGDGDGAVAVVPRGGFGVQEAVDEVGVDAVDDSADVVLLFGQQVIQVVALVFGVVHVRFGVVQFVVEIADVVVDCEQVFVDVASDECVVLRDDSVERDAEGVQRAVDVLCVVRPAVVRVVFDLGHGVGRLFDEVQGVQFGADLVDGGAHAGGGHDVCDADAGAVAVAVFAHGADGGGDGAVGAYGDAQAVAWGEGAVQLQEVRDEAQDGVVVCVGGGFQGSVFFECEVEV